MVLLIIEAFLTEIIATKSARMHNYFFANSLLAFSTFRWLGRFSGGQLPVLLYLVEQLELLETVLFLAEAFERHLFQFILEVFGTHLTRVTSHQGHSHRISFRITGTFMIIKVFPLDICLTEVAL